MNLRIPGIRNAQHAGRIAGAALVAAGLMFGVGVRDAAAGAPWAPEIVSVDQIEDQPNSMRIRFKDRAVDEEAFNIIYGEGMAMDRRVENVPALPGAGSTSWAYVDGLRTQTTYCFKMEAWHWEEIGPFGIGGKRKVWSLVPSETKCGTTPALEVVSFESSNLPGHFIRHRNALGYITTISTPLDRADASWIVRPALNSTPGAVSFESVNFPSTYLRHQNFRLKQHPNDGTPQFKADASFYVRPGLAGGDTKSFQAVNVPGRHYIRHANYELSIAPDDGSELFRKDASYHLRPPHQRPPR